VKSPQTNGICERFHKTVLSEFYRVAFRNNLYTTLAEPQADMDGWLAVYNEQWPHQGRWCYGRTAAADVRGQRAAGEGEDPGCVTRNGHDQ